MKRFIVFFSVALFILLSAVSISCNKNKETEKCIDLINQVNAAQITYDVSHTTANCQAYKTALNNLLGCSALSTQEKAAYQLLFNQLTC